MKKNLFLLVALLCSVTFFTACDDGEDDSWKQLPSGEITADNVKLELNGESTTGTIDFKVLGSEAAQLNIKNVIDGYSEVPVDVKMAKLADGSYKLDGTYETMAKPVTKAANAAASMLKVTVDGTISLDGKLTANIVASGPGLYIGTYNGKTLVLSYGESVLTGKEVVFDGTTGDNVSILFKDVIPGEKETTLTGVQVSDGKFTGTTETTYATVNYTGSRKDKVLTLDLKVTMKDPLKVAKSYKLGEYVNGSIEVNGEVMESAALSGAMYMKWTAMNGSDDYGLPYSLLYKGIGGFLLPQVLSSITLEADGNIGAEYSTGSSIKFDMGMAMSFLMGQAPSVDDLNKLIPTTGWKKSPKNLAYWYAKDSKIYIKLNIPGIIAQSMGGNGSADLSGIISQVLNGDPATVKGLIAKMLNVDLSGVSDASFAMLLDWVNNGIPLSVKTEKGHTYMYLDQEAFDPIFKMRPIEGDPWNSETSDLLQVWEALSAANVIPEDYQMAGFLLGAFSSFWSSTTDFGIGLDLQAK